MTLNPGDAVTSDFVGAIKTKKRPSVVISTSTYHNHRPDVLLCLLTTRIDKATAPTDYVLQDWTSAGLRRPSAARCFLVTTPMTEVTHIGHLSDQDWQEVQARLKLAIEL